MKIIKHPSSAKCYKLGQIFLDLAKKYPKAEVNMHTNRWSQTKDKKTVCGTPACHAGWYGFAISLQKEYEHEPDFTDAANRMAEFLGFESKLVLENWADKFKKLWGNEEGGQMFYEQRAFEIQDDSYITLKDIGNHWKNVGRRIKTNVETKRKKA